MSDNNNIGNNAVSTFLGIVLALIVVFVVLPMASCVGCVTCCRVNQSLNGR